MLLLTQLCWQFVLTVLLADFTAGFIHWLQDAYGRADFPVTGRLFTQPNILHHRNPRHFTRHGWLRSSWDLVLLNAAVLLVAYWSGHLTWHVWVFACIGANANQIHKWAHRSPKTNGRVITLAQRLRLLQTPRHHLRHHTNPKNSHYCTITNALNPVLDGLHFWGGLELLIAALFAIKRRVDPTVCSTRGDRAF